jgi:large subunit ribosomal protein L4
MATLEVLGAGKRKAGKVELDPSVFEAPVRAHLFHAEVRRQLAKRRQGTHSTKNRAGVSGGGIKPWKQKGTGRARQGSIRAPQWAGGGVVFGPVPRSYEHTLPKKVRKAALRAALSQKLREGNIKVVDELEIGEYKTKRVAQLLRDLSLADAPLLIVIAAEDGFLERSARNLPGVSVLRVAGLNVYDVLRHGRLLLTKAAVAAIGERLHTERAEAAS